MMKIFFTTFIISIICQNILSQDTWEIIDTPPDIGIHDIALTSTQNIFLGVAFPNGGGIIRKLCDEDSWDTVLFFNTDIIGTVYIDNTDNIFAASKHLYLSQDNGETWDLLYSNPVFGITSILKTSNGNILIGTWGEILKSDSLGEDWTQVVGLDINEAAHAIVEDTNSNKLYSGTSCFTGGGGVYVSTDEGESWQHIGLEDHYVSSLAINSSSDLIAGTKGHHYLYTGGVYILPNEQSTWFNLNNDELVTSLEINSLGYLYIGCSTLDFAMGGIRRSFDNGQTWEDMSLETMYDHDIYDIILGPSEYLYINESSSTTPLYKTINQTITSVNKGLIKNEITTYNFPNPFTNQTTIYISRTNCDPIDMSISIMNSHGEVIKKIHFLKSINNDQLITLNLEGLPAGIYYYILDSERFQTYNKMVLR